MRLSTSVGPADSLVRLLLRRVNCLVDEVCRQYNSRRISLMEVCGTHTMVISRSGIRRAVDRRLELRSGPGCPVCVTSQEEIDAAIALARCPGVTVATFGDMMRVPGATGSLEQARVAGADVRVVYSALDAVGLAASERVRQFVFLGVGFETTASTVAAAVLAAGKHRLTNFSVLPMFKLIPPALARIAGASRVNIDGFILPGHVSTVLGAKPYQFLAQQYCKPCCITGFEVLDVVQGILMLLEQLAKQEPQVVIQYRRTVRPDGNRQAQRLMSRVFEPVDAVWRGIGPIPDSGLAFRPKFHGFDSRIKLGLTGTARPIGRTKRSRVACRCGEVMLGVIMPPECRLFGKACTPEKPVGPCMVSSEGACAAYYKYEQ